MREALEGFKGGVKFGGSKITTLRYADDTTLICSSKEELMEYSMINTSSDTTTEVKRRLAMARTSTQKINNIWKSRGLSIQIKLQFL